jgi:cyclase
VSINSAAVARPEVLTECAERFGAQCVVASIDARRDGARGACTRTEASGPTDLEAVAWARECVKRGAGEVLLTSIDRDWGPFGV